MINVRKIALTLALVGTISSVPTCAYAKSSVNSGNDVTYVKG